MNSERFFSEKKGDMSWATISLIILAVSLVVIVAIFINLNASLSLDREACHTSVVLRGTLPDVNVPVPGKAGLKDSVSVNCKTKRVCVSTSSKGNCSSIFSKDFETLQVSGNVEEKKRQISQIIAREMADCWNMMGEGKLAVFSREVVWGSSYSTAGLICTRIMFDNTIISPKKTEDKIISLPEFDKYLLTHKVPTRNISYWDYFRDTPEGDSLARLAGSDFTEGSSLNLTKEKAVMYMEFKASEAGNVVGATIGTAAWAVINVWTKGSIIKTIGVKNTASLTLLIAGASSVLGEEVSKFIGTTEKENSVPGLFLLDYSAGGFEKLDFLKDKFYLANIP